MFLTQIMADAITVQTRRLFDAYRWKQALYEAFTVSSGSDCPFLYDIQEKKRGEVKVLLLSSLQPKILPFGTWQTKQIPPSFYDGTRYLFELTANPTCKKVIYDSNGKKKRQGKRVGLLPANHEDWLRRKLTAAGCSVEGVSVDKVWMRVCQHKGSLTKHMAARFRGVLNVNSRDFFKAAVIEGVGPAKGFGFGMLLLKRV